MSVQQDCPSRLPDRVEVEIFGQRVTADVVGTTLDAAAGGETQDLLSISVDGRRYRVPAEDADPADVR
jgi:hypothetical protein